MRWLAGALCLAVLLGADVAHAKRGKQLPIIRPFTPAPRTVRYQAAPPDMDLGGYAAADVANGVVYTSGPLDAFARAHETAHVLDWQVLTDADRAYFSKLLHAPRGGDYWGRTEDGKPSPQAAAAEYFADYYAAAAIGYQPRPNHFLDSYAKIGPKRLRRFEKALRRVAKRAALTHPYYDGRQQ